MGEALAFNGFDLNLRININHKEYPLPRHMKVLKVLKHSFTVAFKNHVLPGIGYANFFNSLKLEPLVLIEKCGYKGKTTICSIPSAFISAIADSVKGCQYLIAM